MNRKEITSINNRTYELMYNNYYDITTVTEIIDNGNIESLELKYIGYCYGDLKDNETINFIKDMIYSYEKK